MARPVPGRTAPRIRETARARRETPRAESRRRSTSRRCGARQASARRPGPAGRTTFGRRVPRAGRSGAPQACIACRRQCETSIAPRARRPAAAPGPARASSSSRLRRAPAVRLRMVRPSRPHRHAVVADFETSDGRVEPQVGATRGRARAGAPTQRFRDRGHRHAARIARRRRLAGSAPALARRSLGDHTWTGTPWRAALMRAPPTSCPSAGPIMRPPVGLVKARARFRLELGPEAESPLHHRHVVWMLVGRLADDA